jgi:hypothetical protein
MIPRALACALLVIACETATPDSTSSTSLSVKPEPAKLEPAQSQPAATPGKPAAPVHGNAESAGPAQPLDKLPNGRVGIGPFAAQVPADWTELPRSTNMRTAYFHLPAAAGSKAELIVYHFGKRGAGSVQDNVDRWLSQFQQADGKPSRDVAKIEKAVLGGREVNLVSVAGRYVAPATPGGPAIDVPGQSLVAAIVESPEGPYYFRLVGASAAVEAQTAPFRAMLESMTLR